MQDSYKRLLTVLLSQNAYSCITLQWANVNVSWYWEILLDSEKKSWEEVDHCLIY